MTHPSRRIAGAAVAALCAAGLSVPLASVPTEAAAAADPGTITFIKDHNVWIARGDGTQARPLTTDGHAGLPYRAPSQSDTGLVAAVRYSHIVTMDQQGRVIAEIDPPRLPDSLGTSMDGSPVATAVSPDGALIAYTFAEYSCGSGCQWRTATGYVSTSGGGTPATYGSSFFADPSWVTNRRALHSGGFNYHVMVHDIGSPTQQHWFDDGDIWSPSDDFGNVEVSPDATLLAGVRGSGDDRDILTYRIAGDIRSGALPGPPDDACRLDGGAADRITDPTWSPDSSTLAFAASDGVWTFADNKTPGCGGELRLLLPGASQPDWSAAPLAPPAAAPALVNLERAAVRGRARVGKVLRATSGRWSAGVTVVSYQWLRNGRAIKGATGQRYKVRRADRARRVSVRVTVRSATATGVSVSKATRVRR
ncbi:hypothetical protein [Nocardioides daeguensis]|nr:hypothetical protein [Nocardioides daeguensis]MBV6727100.1 hypothetical protein [Nocardioides daeguensis]MCR1771497.1 hypothetical protein [Nocardioides daeguensis]